MLVDVGFVESSFQTHWITSAKLQLCSIVILSKLWRYYHRFQTQNGRKTSSWDFFFLALRLIYSILPGDKRIWKWDINQSNALLLWQCRRDLRAVSRVFVKMQLLFKYLGLAYVYFMYVSEYWMYVFSVITE